MNKSKITSIRLPEAMRQRLERIAKLEQRSLSNVIKMMIDEGIKRRLDAAWEKRNVL